MQQPDMQACTGTRASFRVHLLTSFHIHTFLSTRFAKISEVLDGGTYEVMVAHSAQGPLYKTGVPAQYLGKLSQQVTWR